MNKKVVKKKGQWIFAKNKQKYIKIKKKKAHFLEKEGGLRRKNRLRGNQIFLRGDYDVFYCNKKIHNVVYSKNYIQ